MKENAIGYYRDLIDKGIAQGDISPEIDPNLAAFVLGAVLNQFGNYLFKEIQDGSNALD